jgi:hypothetical protein
VPNLIVQQGEFAEAHNEAAFAKLALVAHVALVALDQRKLWAKPRNIVVMRSAWVLAVCLLSVTSFAQETGPTGPDAEYAPCLEGQQGVRVYESPQLTSPDGQWRAYASVEARPDSSFGYSDTSTLLLEGPRKFNFQTVHTIKPEPQSHGNGMVPISWSPQHHLLAVRVFYWQDGSDAAGRSVLIYDADRRRAIEPDFANLFTRKYTKKECAFSIQDVLGFDSQNRVLFSADDVIEPGDDEPTAETRCLGGPGVWALDIEKNQLEFVKHLEPEDSQ